MDWAHVTDFLLQVNPDSIYSKRKRAAPAPFPSFHDIIDATGILLIMKIIFIETKDCYLLIKFNTAWKFH